MNAQIARLKFEQLDEALQSILQPRVQRLGYLGEFFQCTGSQPQILAPFMEMTEALKVALPDNITELGALTVAVVMGNTYERHQHERLSRKLGFSDAWIRAIELIAPDIGSELSDDERAVQRLIVAAIERKGQGISGEMDAVIEAIGPDRTVAVLFLIGRYLTHAVIVNALGLAPPVPSIFSEAVA